MQNNKSLMPLALPLLALLIVTRWGLLPLLEWQQQTVTSIEDNRRSEQVNSAMLVAAKAAQKSIPESLSALNQWQQWLPAANSIGALQVQVQRQLESGLSQYQLTTQKLEWGQRIEYQLPAVQLKLNVGGAGGNVIRWLSELDSMRPWLAPDKISAYQDKRKAGHINAQIDFLVFYQAPQSTTQEGQSLGVEGAADAL